MFTLYLVLPCYNEQEVLLQTAKQLQQKIESLQTQGRISGRSRIVFVNDGSKDATWEIITQLHEGNALFSGINLSRNRGHQNALLAGLMTVRELADAVISMDADLQDDPSCIDKMVDAFEKGSDIVYGVRADRSTDTAIKRVPAMGFYRVMKKMGVELICNHADCRLMSRRALSALAAYPETNLFLRGMVPMIGYPSSTVYYDRNARLAGESKYPLKKQLELAWQGITSMSMKPIRVITGSGIFLTLLSLALMIVFGSMQSAGLEKGILFVLLSVFLVGGLQLTAIGVVGEYVGRNYLETKRRPRYLVQDFLHSEP